MKWTLSILLSRSLNCSNMCQTSFLKIRTKLYALQGKHNNFETMRKSATDILHICSESFFILSQLLVPRQDIISHNQFKYSMNDKIQVDRENDFSLCELDVFPFLLKINFPFEPIAICTFANIFLSDALFQGRLAIILVRSCVATKGSRSIFFGFCCLPEHSTMDDPPMTPITHDRTQARLTSTEFSRPQAYNTAAIPTVVGRIHHFIFPFTAGIKRKQPQVVQGLKPDRGWLG